MAKRGRPPVEITLTGTERRQPESWARRHTTAQHLARRCKIVLACSDPTLTGGQIADQVGCSPATVTKWRKRFADKRLDGLMDAPRPGAVRTIGDDVIEAVVIDTLESAPKDATHWSTRSMAQHHGISRQTVSKIWRAFGLKPWEIDEFKISPDPQLVDKIRDIVGLYMNPPSNSMVLCVDEKTQIQALDRTQPGLPLSEGKIGSRTHDYKRHGTSCLYAAFNTLTGKVIGKMTKRTRSKEFLSFMKKVERSTPRNKDLHVILDNHSAHKTAEVKEWLAINPRVHFHFTPTSSSWLNAVEGWFAQLERRALYRGVFTSVTELDAEIRRFIKVHNKHSAKPFKWTKDANVILKSVERAKNALPN